MARLNVRTLNEGYSVELTDEQKADMLAAKELHEAYEKIHHKIRSESFEAATKSLAQMKAHHRKMDAINAYIWPSVHTDMAVTLEE